ncbi:hypothetical protein Tco_1317115 [Tanacetum coccineum]
MARTKCSAQPLQDTDEQIVPRSQWLTIEKSNLLFNAQKIQRNPIFQISVDILSNTNFFQAFTALANVPAIYLQQFWKTMSYNEKTRVYSCQVDEQWFDLSADLLIKALAITPVNPTYPFELPPSGDTVIDFVNELGYPEPVEIVSSIRVNYVYQPWRAILSLLNQCLTGKTSGKGLIWEEVDSRIHTFFSQQSKPQSQSEEPQRKKVTPLLTLWTVFQSDNYYLLSNNNSIDVLFCCSIHWKMIISRKSQVCSKENPSRKCKRATCNKAWQPKKPTTTTPVKQSKPAPPPTKKPSKRKLPQKIRKGKPTFQLVDEEDEARQDDDPDLDLAKKLSLEAHQEKGEEEGNDADLERAIKLSLDPTFLPQGRAPVGGVTIRDPVSETTSKLHEVVGKGKAVVSEEQVAHSLIDMSKVKELLISLSWLGVIKLHPIRTTWTTPSQPEDDPSEKYL